jgi:TonB family protein
VTDRGGPSTGVEGGVRKWLIGAAVASLLLGGGYFAWQTFGQDDAREDTSAYNEETPTGAAHVSPAGPSEEMLAENIAPEETAPASPSARAPAPVRRQAPRAEPIPEATIGITPESATTEASEEDEIVVTAPRRPIWISTPSAQRLSALYPERALERGREGEALLHCLVEDGGALRCEETSATAGGFGAAAMRVARTFRHAPTLANGASATGSPLNLRVVFRMEEERRGRRR